MVQKNLFTAIFASLVIYIFQETIDKVVYLAILMPIVANMGGVAGTQTLTLVIRSLALGHISPSNSRWLLVRELGVATINGIIWASLISLIAFIWYQDIKISYIIAAATIINLIINLLLVKLLRTKIIILFGFFFSLTNDSIYKLCIYKII